ncbi:VIT1/CCC1 transporter family protein [Nonomuraea ferruginea]
MTIELERTYTPEMHHSHRDVTGGWLRLSGVRGDGRARLQLRADRRCGGGPRVPGGAPCSPGSPGWWRVRARWRLGEYTSVKSQTELMRAEIAVERRELARNPEGERAELAALYRSRGLEPELAEQVAAGLSADPDQALRVHVREELGVDPDDLPSPKLAAVSSFCAFSAGALVPLVPFFFGASGLALAVVLSVLALFGFGAVVAHLTARPWWVGGLRQLVLGVGAAAVTFGIGHLLGVAVS